MPQRSNHIVGFCFAAGTVYALYHVLTDPTLHLLGGVGITAYLLGVVLDAWIRITLFWYRRGTSGMKTWRCGGCGKHIHWKPRDWVLECKSCGWKPGLPVVRWIWYSIPVVQARRRRLIAGTVRTSIVAAVVVGILLLPIGGAVVAESVVSDTVAAVDDVDLDPGGEGTPRQPPQATHSTGEAPTQTSTPTATPTPTRTERPGIRPRAAERAILEATNEIRAEHGLSSLSWSDSLHQRALEHSRNMGQHGFYHHGGPSGESERSRMRDLTQFCGGAASENIHKGEPFTRLRIYGSSETIRLTGPNSIARYATIGWMNSKGHRENMLDQRWTRAGVGVYSSGSMIYMTIIFCS